MALSRRKILETAQKHLQKGSLDRALKEYTALLQVDARDANARLKIGDIQLRRGNRQEAISAYLRVAEQFMQDGFDAKAVAIYKQVAKIDPKRHDVYLPLAELYQRLGLTSEAISALQTAADAYKREGREKDALELLRKTSSLDPSNTTSRLKIADLLRQAELCEDAVAEYEDVAAELVRQGDSDRAISTYERVLEIAPERVSTLVSLGRVQLEQRRHAEAEERGRRALEIDDAHAPAHELLIEVYRAAGRDDDLRAQERRLAELLRHRGEEDRAKDIFQRLPSRPIGEEPGEAGSLEAVEAEDGHPALESAAVEALGFEPDQVIAEAGVYFKFGKHERAAQTLRTVLDQDPDHTGALEAIGEAFVAQGAPEPAREAWARAVLVARERRDAETLERLAQRLEELPPVEPAQPGGPAAADIEPEPVVGVAPGEADVEVTQPVSDFVDTGEEPGAAGSEAPAEQEVEVTGVPTDRESGAFELEAEVELVPEPDDVGAGGEEASEQSASVEAEVAADTATAESELFEITLDDASLDTSAEARPTQAVEADAGGPTPDPSSSTTPQPIAEDLEEAEFYFGQQLHDEAEAIYQRVLEAAPNHPRALLRLGEIAELRGERPEAGEQAGFAPPPASATEPDVPELEGSEGAPDARAAEVEPDTYEDGPLAAADDGAEAPMEDGLEDLEGLAGGELDLGLDEEPPGDERPLDVPAPDAEGDADALLEDVDEDAEDDADALLEEADEVAEDDPDALLDEAPVVGVGEEELATAEPEGDAFDLAAELTEVLEEAEGAPPGASPPATPVDDGFESIFHDFKRGVSRTLEEGDTETRYDLGIAYKEMGLLEDAIGEFQLASRSSGRRRDALHMLALCGLELGHSGDAVCHLEQALSDRDVPEREAMALRFDLARAFEAQGERERAREAFEAVAAIDPEFQAVRERLAALDRPDGAAPEVGAADGAEAPDELFESFDDVLAEARANLGSDTPPGAGPPTRRGPGRRRKISFG